MSSRSDGSPSPETASQRPYARRRCDRRRRSPGSLAHGRQYRCRPASPRFTHGSEYASVASVWEFLIPSRCPSSPPHHPCRRCYQPWHSRNLKNEALIPLEEDDRSLRRFLRARGHNIGKASAMTLRYLQWKREEKPGGGAMITDEKVRNELVQEKLYMQGFDKQHRPLL
ncbi:hypothetical protein GUJ93_ZPchr0013g34673 [Zizania palustris]|uniref:CRAL/TRIO N-terminal domain-containing protein n=1 Tax=Zizania palustris TaxID=103762 RepID=A0A8J5WWG2_ZIZPA|nr:hypothetical protein GUJ93_ZPchr0013g34673 [Zizania palustris]